MASIYFCQHLTLRFGFGFVQMWSGLAPIPIDQHTRSKWLLSVGIPISLYRILFVARIYIYIYIYNTKFTSKRCWIICDLRIEWNINEIKKVMSENRNVFIVIWLGSDAIFNTWHLPPTLLIVVVVKHECVVPNVEWCMMQFQNDACLNLRTREWKNRKED